MAIELEGVRVVRGGVEILAGVSLTVAAGSVTGLLGPSGCGKTTLMRTVMGAQRVAAGSVTVLGAPAGTRALRARVGYVTQAPSVYLDLTVQENLGYFAAVLGAPATRVDEVLETVDLVAVRDRIAGVLSGGQRSRVSLATALLGDPDLLVLDEPTTGLDPVLRRDLWNTFRNLAAGGTTLLVSSHQLDEADECSDLILMRDGRVLVQATPAELRARTGQHDMRRAFLAVVEAPA